MARVITDQIVASTSLDSHGERLPEAELTAYFNQMTEGAVGAASHDLTQVPAFRSFNKRLVRTAAGDLAIVVDIEVLDEERYATYGGYSIAFTRRHWRFGRAPSYPRVTINTRQFDFEAAGPSLSRQLARTPFELVERIEKIDVATLAIIGIAVGGYFVAKVTASAIAHVFSGFFEEAGKDLYQAAKGLVRSDEPAGPVEIQFHLHVHEPPRRPVIVIRADPRCTEADVATITREQLEKLLSLAEAADFDRISAELLPGGTLRHVSTVLKSGEVLVQPSSVSKQRSNNNGTTTTSAASRATAPTVRNSHKRKKRRK
ncbi:MAG: hypothetical protein JO231_20040 [Acidobacteria bacterium]|nr:hypothetical protein [Acidobacteriota bacterium]